jgi:hypothetical protein
MLSDPQTPSTNSSNDISHNIFHNSSEKPFVIELWEENKQPGGHFTPAAALNVTASLRTSGLLRELSPDDCKSLLTLLTFVSPEGHCQPFLSQLAEAMHVLPAKAKARMRRLCDVRWKGEPIVIFSKSASGLSAYSLNPRLVTYRHREEATRRESNRHQSPSYAAPREAIIEHSRHHYARPRAEVERMIAHQMGHDMGESEDERKLRFRLENAGLTREQAKELLATYDLDSIAQQLDWLPYRHAKNPAGYLIAAIEGGYSEPRAVREERLYRELRYGELQAADADTDRAEGEEPAEAPRNVSEGTQEDTALPDSSGSNAGLQTEGLQTEAAMQSLLPVDDLKANQEIALPLPGNQNVPEDKIAPDKPNER